MLARSTALNLVGLGAPLLVAIWAIPLLIKGVGTDRFGVLSLAWALIGYLSMFDLGIGRALTKLVAEKLGQGQEQQVPPVVWTSLLLMLVLGVVGMVAFILLTHWLVHGALKIPEVLRRETLGAFGLLAVSIPFVTGSAGLRGVLEARQRFGLSNAVRVPMGVFTFAAPVAVMPFSTSLVALVGVLVFGRILGWAAYLIVCVRTVPGMRGLPVVSRAVVRPLLGFGSWMTVNGIVGSLMLTMDRFIIGAIVSVTAVAYYATPYEVVTKMWLVAGAVSGVLFPAFATSFASDRARMTKLFDRGSLALVALLLPVSLVIILFAREGLELWLGHPFALASFRVAQALAIGAFLLGVANVPYALLQGVGRPDLPAKVNLVELPLYLAALAWSVKGYGIVGAATVWAARAAADACVHFWLARPYLVNGSRSVGRVGTIAGLCLCALLAAAWPATLAAKSAFLVATLTLFALGIWFRALDLGERAVLGRGLRLLRR